MELNLNSLSLNAIAHQMADQAALSLSEDCMNKINVCRSYLDRKLASSQEPIYGVNTGFGSLYNQSIDTNKLSDLQENLIRSHACGMGDLVPKEICKLILLLKIRGLSLGHSGVQLSTVQRLMDLYNHDLIPVIFEQGSLGASGDLAPLAHMALALLGEGEVWNEGARLSTSVALKNLQWSPLSLQSKEGLALLNGTQFMSAYGTYCLIEGKKLLDWADLIGALSLEAFDGRPEPFIAEVHEVRNHKGQIETAERFRKLFEGSEVINRAKEHVQDPYSFRCIPQVHGASRDVMRHVWQVFEDEVNAVTDNPTIFPEQDLIVSAGNFHGQPLALGLDHWSMALAEIGSISERRTYKLISGQRNLPAFLVKNPGLNSGMMIPQYTAASIVSQNKAYCTPNCVDTIDSSNGQEDHVSMGANAATKTLKVLNNLRRILAIELFNAVQAFEFRRPAKTSASLEKLMLEFRESVPFIEEDEFLHPHLSTSEKFLKTQNPHDYLP